MRGPVVCRDPAQDKHFDMPELPVFPSVFCAQRKESLVLLIKNKTNLSEGKKNGNGELGRSLPQQEEADPASIASKWEKSASSYGSYGLMRGDGGWEAAQARGNVPTVLHCWWSSQVCQLYHWYLPSGRCGEEE